MAYDLEIAAITIYCEASDQPDIAKLGVAWSMVNRLLVPGKPYGWTIAEICLRRMQYSEWNADRQDNANLIRAARCQSSDPLILDCRAMIEGALANTSSDPTRGATHYYDGSIAAPYWTEPPATKTAQLGKLLFYKGVP